MSEDGVQKIISEIENNAEKEVSEIMGEARNRADALLSEAREKADDQRGAVITRGEQESRRESQRILAEARIKAKREKDSVQEKMVQASFDKARQELSRLAQERKIDGVDYRAVIERLIRESVLAAGVESAEVIVTAKDRELVTGEMLSGISAQLQPQLGFKPRLLVSEESLPGTGGVVVRGADGRVCVDNSFESRIERFTGTVRTRVAKELFGQEQ